jgi:hypothetical protein
VAHGPATGLSGTGGGRCRSRETRRRWMRLAAHIRVDGRRWMRPAARERRGEECSEAMLPSALHPHHHQLTVCSRKKMMMRSESSTMTASNRC